MGLRLCHTLLLAWFFATTALCAGPTKIYINTYKLSCTQIPAYSLLESCAEYAVSTIVRDMSAGCGDGSQETSYACFCYESSAKISSIIGAHVSSACNPTFPQQNSSAIGVFDSYCKLGAVAPTGIVTSASPLPTKSIASPGSGPTSSAASPTSTPNTLLPPPTKKTNVAAIAAGVTVPIVIIALALAGFLIWRRKKKTERPIELAAGGGGGEPSSEVYELKQGMVPVEIEGDARRAELSPAAPSYELGGTTHELDGLAREKMPM